MQVNCSSKSLSSSITFILLMAQDKSRFSSFSWWNDATFPWRNWSPKTLVVLTIISLLIPFLKQSLYLFGSSIKDSEIKPLPLTKPFTLQNMYYNDGNICLQQDIICNKHLPAASLCMQEAFVCSKPLPTSLQLLKDMEVNNFWVKIFQKIIPPINRPFPSIIPTPKIFF